MLLAEVLRRVQANADLLSSVSLADLTRFLQICARLPADWTAASGFLLPQAAHLLSQEISLTHVQVSHCWDAFGDLIQSNAHWFNEPRFFCPEESLFMRYELREFYYIKTSSVPLNTMLAIS